MRAYYILWYDSHTHGNHVSQGLPGTEICSSGSAGLQLATDHVCIISFNLSKKKKNTVLTLKLQTICQLQPISLPKNV